MVKIKFGALVLAAWFLLLGFFMFGGRTKSTDQHQHNLTGNPLKGRHVLASKGCLNCHSVWGGQGKQGPDLASVSLGKSLVQIAGLFWSHPPNAAPLTAEEMTDLISYLYYNNYVNEPGDAAAGRDLFSEKGCINCHSIGSQGGSVGPPLDQFENAASTLAVAQAMWNHSPMMSNRMAQAGVSKPEFKEREMANLLAFIRRRAADYLPDEKFLLPGSSVAGQRMFTEKGCIRCHSIYGEGGKVGPDLSRRGYYATVADIAGAMWNHDAMMSLKAKQVGATRATFNNTELADIIAYLYFTRATDLPGDVSNGKKLFDQNGCGECHNEGVRGSRSAPDIRMAAAITSPIKLAAVMWNHSQRIRTVPQGNIRPWIKLDEDDTEDLAAYVKATGRQSDQSEK